jgi:hypothetical protein
MGQTIALLTDFGITDTYVGVMKGVILSICPDAQIVDLTHAIPPQDVRAGALALVGAYRYFAPGTILVTIVDPGVGSARRAAAVVADGWTLIAPDNGVLSYTLRQLHASCAFEISAPRYRLADVSHTFHGRDVFAPAAAHLAAGVEIGALGAAIPADELVSLSVPRLQMGSDQVVSEVIAIDHFGNVTTGVGWLRWQRDRLRLESPFLKHDPLMLDARSAEMLVGKLTLRGIRRTYAETLPGAALALVGSTGFLEIAVNQGSAAEAFGLKVGDLVTLKMG